MILRLRSVLVRTAVAAAALALAVGPVRAADPFEIYALFPMTGPAAFFGQEEAKGIAMVEAAVNKTGGINGRPVKFVIRDNQSSPPVAVSLMGQILSTNPAIVLEGGSLPTCLAAAGLLKADGPLLFCTSASIPQTPGSYVFAASPATVDQMEVGINNFRLRGFTKIATITATEAVGQDFDRHVDGVMALPQNRGMTVVAREHFNFTDLSVNAQMERIKAAGAQAVFSYTNGAPMGTVFRALKEVSPNTPILACACDLSYVLMERFADVLPNDVEVLSFPAYAPNTLPRTDSVRRAVDAMYDAMKTAGLSRPEIGTVVQWNQANLAVNALRKLGTNATAQQVRDYFNSLTAYPGVLGMLNYRDVPQTGAVKGWVLITRWDPAAHQFVPISRPGGEPLKK
jgi:branched-chain amino acid transport system substrate-binding protein